jgi:hypothetical protein
MGFDCKICGEREVWAFESEKYPGVCCCCAAKTYEEKVLKHYIKKDGKLVLVTCQEYMESEDYSVDNYITACI